MGGCTNKYKMGRGLLRSTKGGGCYYKRRRGVTQEYNKVLKCALVVLEIILKGLQGMNKTHNVSIHPAYIRV